MTNRPVAKLLRFGSIMSTALAMSAAVAHLMELPPKRRYEPSTYVRLHRTLYEYFGKAAGPAESIAVVTTSSLAWWTRQHDRQTSQSTLAAAGCLAAAHAVYWSVVQPVNVRMMRWPLEAIPADWVRWRDRWEYGHAVRAGLVTTAMGALTVSLLRRSA